MSEKKTPGTSGLMPTRGSGCGIRPSEEALDILELGDGIDFSEAETLLKDSRSVDSKSTKKRTSKSDE